MTTRNHEDPFFEYIVGIAPEGRPTIAGGHVVKKKVEVQTQQSENGVVAEQHSAGMPKQNQTKPEANQVQKAEKDEKVLLTLAK